MKTLMKTSMELTKTGVATGIGASVISQSGGDASIMTGFSKHLPTVGNVEGAGAVMGGLKKFKKY